MKRPRNGSFFFATNNFTIRRGCINFDTQINNTQAQTKIQTNERRR